MKVLQTPEDVVDFVLFIYEKEDLTWEKKYSIISSLRIIDRLFHQYGIKFYSGDRTRESGIDKHVLDSYIDSIKDYFGNDKKTDEFVEEFYKQKKEAILQLELIKGIETQHQNVELAFNILKNRFKNIKFEKTDSNYISGSFSCYGCDMKINFTPSTVEYDYFHVEIGTAEYMYNKKELIKLSYINKDDLIQRIKKSVNEFIVEFQNKFE